MITPNSRYAQGVLTRNQDGNGIFQLTLSRSVPAQNIRFALYVWKMTDRPDIVAAAQLGDPSLWWAIFDINPEIIYPLNVPAGSVVRIPIGPVAGQGTLLQ